MKNGSTPYFGRRNLVAREGIRFDGHPSEARPERPPLKTKEAYRAWCADPATDHAFISLVEPENPRAAVNADNPPRLLHGVIADYDSPRVAEMAAAAGFTHITIAQGASNQALTAALELRKME